MKDVTTFVYTHKTTKKSVRNFFDESCRFIQCGSWTNERLDADYHDDEGNEEISRYNPYLSEATGLFWIGNNINSICKTKYIEFAHYRRRIIYDFDDLSDDNIICTPMNLVSKKQTVLEQFLETHNEYVNITDTVMCLDVEKSLKMDIMRYLCKSSFFANCNIFVMTVGKFKEYFRFIKPCIESIVKMLENEALKGEYGFLELNEYHKRYYAFVIERLTSYWIYRNTNHGTKNIVRRDFKMFDGGIQTFVQKKQTDDKILKNCICWCVDTDLNSNVLMLQSLMSFRKNNPLGIDYFVLTTRDNPFVHYLKSNGGVAVKFVDDLCDKFLSNSIPTSFGNRYSKCVYYRFFLMHDEVLLNTHDKILYVDNDTICKADIRTIFDCKLECPIVMAEEKNNPEIRLNLEKQMKKRKINLKIDKYFNAGVFLLNVKHLKDDDFKRCIESVKMNFTFNDQDIINYVFNGRIGNLDGSYNCFGATYDISKPHSIRHFCFSEKEQLTEIYSSNWIKYVMNERMK